MTNARAAEVLSMAATYNGCGRATSDELKKALSMADAALREQGHWISVKDRLPEQFQKVLVCRFLPSNKWIVEQGYKDLNDWWKVYGTRTKRVFYWMPLPEPPKET